MCIRNNLLISFERSIFKCLAGKKGKDIKSLHTKERRNLEKTGIRKNNIVNLYLFIIFFLTFFVFNAYSESLWTPNFEGYLTEGLTVGIDDIIIVDIDSNFSLSYKSSSSDSKILTLEFIGGEYGNLLAFLPSISSGGDRSVSGEEEFSLSTSFVTRVADVSPTGLIFVRGSQTITVEGKEAAITISGWISTRDLGSDRRIPFSLMADSTVVYSSFLEPPEDTLASEDIEEVFEEAPIVPQAEGEVTEEPTVMEEPAEIEEEVTEEPAVTELETELRSLGFSLTEEKKLELFLLYVNRLIDILFR